MRKAKIERKTSETNITLVLNLDGNGDYSISTGTKFLDHMLGSFAKHGCFDLKIKATGDNEHHIVEDTAICLGNAFSKAIGDKAGIKRFGFSVVPMDDVLLLTSVDLSSRSHCSIGVKFRRKKIEDLSSEMISHFLESLTSETKMNLHVKLLDGKNEHHIAEAIFKSLALSMDMATSKDLRKRGVP
ncbi:MAG: imidazoleglycerol-phosphate dehydratase HisB, partial [Candidatus Hydrothermarchaeales archaeon]